MLIRSGIIRCTLLMVLYLDHMCRAGYTRCSGRTSVHLCTRSLQNLAVQQDFYFPLGVLLERSCCPRIRWCGTGGFQEQGQCFFIDLSCSIPTILFYSFSLSLLSVYRLVLWGRGLRTDLAHIMVSLSNLILIPPCYIHLMAAVKLSKRPY